MSSPVAHTPQYSPQSINRYEKIFGRDFVSSGGLATTEALTRGLGLRPGMRVLDVGCGLGGSAFYLARTHGVQVHGIDLLPQMIDEASARAQAYGLTAQVEFQQADILETPLPQSTYDLVYSRDAFLHIADKPRLFSILLDTLRPGGALFLTDYARGPKPGSAQFEAYRENSGYDLRELHDYGAVVQAAGFENVQVDDLTTTLVTALHAEMEATRDAAGFAEEDRDYLLDRWANKVTFCNAGDMRWASIRAQRPA